MQPKTLLVLLTMAAVYVRSASAAPEDFVSPDHLFSLSYPAEFTSSKTTDLAEKSEIALLLRHAQEGYPTFNVLVQPTAYDASGVSLAAQTSRVLESYRLVGITDARILHSALTSLAARQAFSAEIAYRNQGQEFISSLWIVPAGDRHLILTFVDYAANFAAHKYLRDQIVNSLAVFDRPTPPKPTPAWSGKLKFKVALMAAILMLAILVLYASRRAN